MEQGHLTSCATRWRLGTWEGELWAEGGAAFWEWDLFGQSQAQGSGFSILRGCRLASLDDFIPELGFGSKV